MPHRAEGVSPREGSARPKTSAGTRSVFLPRHYGWVASQKHQVSHLTSSGFRVRVRDGTGIDSGFSTVPLGA